MPLYEYQCAQTGDTIELIRPMADADAPVDDPERKGRVFVRKLSTFQAKSNTGKRAPLPSPGNGMPGCGCGNPNGPCNN